MNIEETEVYKLLSKASNAERGHLLNEYKTEIESKLNVTLKRHNYTDLGNLNSENPKMSFLDSIQNIVCIMEFIPNK